VIETVFGETKKAKKWTDLNSCNLIGGGDAEKMCCVDHNKTYDTSEA
jgi:hypothetical protein